MEKISLNIWFLKGLVNSNINTSEYQDPYLDVYKESEESFRIITMVGWDL